MGIKKKNISKHQNIMDLMRDAIVKDLMRDAVVKDALFSHHEAHNEWHGTEDNHHYGYDHHYDLMRDAIVKDDDMRDAIVHDDLLKASGSIKTKHFKAKGSVEEHGMVKKMAKKGARDALLMDDYMRD